MLDDKAGNACFEVHTFLVAGYKLNVWQCSGYLVENEGGGTFDVKDKDVLETENAQTF